MENICISVKHIGDILIIFLGTFFFSGGCKLDELCSRWGQVDNQHPDVNRTLQIDGLWFWVKWGDVGGICIEKLWGLTAFFMGYFRCCI